MANNKGGWFAVLLLIILIALLYQASKTSPPEKKPETLAQSVRVEPASSPGKEPSRGKIEIDKAPVPVKEQIEEPVAREKLSSITFRDVPQDNIAILTLWVIDVKAAMKSRMKKAFQKISRGASPDEELLDTSAYFTYIDEKGIQYNDLLSKSESLVAQIREVTKLLEVRAKDPETTSRTRAVLLETIKKNKASEAELYRIKNEIAVLSDRLRELSVNVGELREVYLSTADVLGRDAAREGVLEPLSNIVNRQE